MWSEKRLKSLTEKKAKNNENSPSEGHASATYNYDSDKGPGFLSSLRGY